MGSLCFHSLVARAHDPLLKESWGCGEKSRRMHGIHSVISCSTHANIRLRLGLRIG